MSGLEDQNLKPVNVVDPDTDEVGSIPASQLPDAISQGFRQAAPEEVDHYFKEKEFGTTGQRVITGLEGAADATTFGLAGAAENALSKSFPELSPERRLARREINPGTRMIGQGIGLVASTALGGAGAANLLGRAGIAGAEAVGLGAAAADAGILAKVGSAAVKGAIDNAIFQGGDEVSKMLASDPEQSASTALANVGLSALLGGGTSGALGAISPLWNATAGKRVSGLLSDLKGNVEGIGEGVGNIPELPADAFQKEMLQDGVAQASEASRSGMTAEALDRLGLEGTTGTLSNSRAVRNMENVLSKRGTVAGQVVQKETEALHEGLAKKAIETLRDRTEMTEAQVGREIKKGLHEGLEAELKPIEARYDALKSHMEAIEVSTNLKKKAAETILGDAVASQFPNSATGKLAQTLAEDLSTIKSVDGLKTYRTMINRKINDAVRNSSETLPVLQLAKQELTAMRESAIEEASQGLGLGKGAKAISDQTIQELREADTLYAAHKSKLKSLGTEAGLGNVNSARGLLERFKKLSDESLATKVFDTNDVNQLQFFKEHFPKEYNLARRYKLKEIYDYSKSTAQGERGAFQTNKFLNKVKDLSPEARVELFPGHAEKIADIKTVYQAMPGTVNPSGTAAALGIGNMFSAQGLLDNASDAVKYAILKSLPSIEKGGATQAEKTGLLHFLGKVDKGVDAEGFKAMSDYIDHVVKGESIINKAVGNIFKAGREVLPEGLMPDKKAKEKLDKRLLALQEDPSPLLDAAGKTSFYMEDHAGHLSQTAMQASNVLNSLRPVPHKMNPLDADQEVSPGEKAKYDRALTLAQQPVSILNHVKAGTLTHEDVALVQSIYPALYAKLGQKMSQGLMEAVHKNEPIPYRTRMGISLFLGQPMDSTLTPGAIHAAQASMAGQMSSTQQRQMRQAQAGPGPHSMKSLSKLPGDYSTPQQARVQHKMGRS